MEFDVLHGLKTAAYLSLAAHAQVLWPRHFYSHVVSFGSMVFGCDTAGSRMMQSL